MTKDKLPKVLLVILALLTTQLNGFAQVTNGLIGYWPFSGNANDASGNGLHGINSGASLITDRNGKQNSAYYFDGISNVITVPHDQRLNTFPLTINFWFKSTQNTNAGFNMIAKYQVNSYNGYNVILMGGNMGNGTVRAGYCTNVQGSHCNDVETVNPLNNNIWHMATAVYTSTDLKVYINGFLAQTEKWFGSTQATSNTRDLLFGKADDPIPYFYQGALDDIGFWNRELTQSEITGLYSTNISGIKDEMNVATGFVYPNPATDQVTINSKFATLNTPYTILDATGRIVSEGKLESKTLSIGTLPKGIYMLRVGSSQQQLLFKVLKQ